MCGGQQRKVELHYIQEMLPCRSETSTDKFDQVSGGSSQAARKYTSGTPSAKTDAATRAWQPRGAIGAGPSNFARRVAHCNLNLNVVEAKFTPPLSLQHQRKAVLWLLFGLCFLFC